MYSPLNTAEINKNTIAETEVNQGWKAELHLGFTRSSVKTLLTQRRHKGPLTVQRPFYPEGGICHVYILHPPGGIVGGDQLNIDVHAATKTEVLITTPAAGKFYRSTDKHAYQSVCLKIEQDAALEWLPQETIIYEGARLQSHVNIELATNARFIGWEIIALGRPAADEGFECGEALLNWRIFRNQKPIYLETMRLDAEAFTARWGLNGRSTCGTLFACSASTENLQTVRELIGDQPGRGVTLIDDLLICRASDNTTEPVRNFFESVRALLRSDIVQRANYAPRIWAT
ncbi:MAG: urease accessory protein UreD [Methylococcales bacterium]